MPGIFAFTVFAHDNPVEVCIFAVSERRRDSRQDMDRAYIYILVELESFVIRAQGRKFS